MTHIRMWLSTAAVAVVVAALVFAPQLSDALTNLPLAQLSSI